MNRSLTLFSLISILPFVASTQVLASGDDANICKNIKIDKLVIRYLVSKLVQSTPSNPQFKTRREEQTVFEFSSKSEVIEKVVVSFTRAEQFLNYSKCNLNQKKMTISYATGQLPAFLELMRIAKNGNKPLFCSQTEYFEPRNNKKVAVHSGSCGLFKQ